MSNFTKTSIITFIAWTISVVGYAQYSHNNYGANRPYSYAPRTSAGCNADGGTSGFRPVQRLAERIRTLGLGRSWVSMGRLPNNSKQRQIGKGVAKWQWGRSVCSATMITPRHAMLNWHCLHGRNAKFGNKYLTFNYEDGVPGQHRRRYRCNRVIMEDRALDMAIIECEGSPGSVFGYAELERGQPPRGTKTFTVHHPRGSSKKYSEGSYYPYNGHTAGMSQIIIPGSSGSSTYDAQSGKMIMLNNKYDWRTNWRGQGWGSKSGRGIKTSYIVNAIERRLGPNFLPKSGSNAVNNSPYIAQNNQAPTTPQLGQVKPQVNQQQYQAPRVNQRPTYPQVNKSPRKMIANYNQGYQYNNQGQSQPALPKVQPQTQRPQINLPQNTAPQINLPQAKVPQVVTGPKVLSPNVNIPSNLNLRRSIAKGVLSQKKAGYLNQSAITPPKMIQPAPNLQQAPIAQNKSQIVPPAQQNAPGQRRVIQFHQGGQNNNRPAYMNPPVQAKPQYAQPPAQTKPQYAQPQQQNTPQYFQPQAQNQQAPNQGLNQGPKVFHANPYDQRALRNNVPAWNNNRPPVHVPVVNGPKSPLVNGQAYRLNRGPQWTPIENLPKGTAPREAGKSVGRFETGEGMCTATLISPSHAILNSHCIDHGSMPRGGAKITFNYEAGKHQSEMASYNCSKVVMQDRSKDVLIVECAGRPGDKQGWVELDEGLVPKNTPTYIVHHPAGSKKKYSEGVFGGAGMGVRTKWEKGPANLVDQRGNPIPGMYQSYPSDPSSAYNTGYITQGSSGSVTFDATTNKVIMLNNTKEEMNGPGYANGHTSASITELMRKRGLGYILDQGKRGNIASR